MATDPTKNVNDQVPGQPQDRNRRPLAALVFPIVVDGEVVGYLYPKVVNEGDGTATLATSGAGGGGGGIDPVGLKNIANVKIDPATEPTLLAIKAQTDKLTFTSIVSIDQLNTLARLWDGTNIASITDSGRLKIDTSPPDAPIDTTPVTVTEFDNVSNFSDNIFVIPTGATLVIQRFSAGAETDTTAGSVIELLLDDDGTGATLTIIDVIFASGSGDQHDLRETILGDGSRAIRMRRRRFSGGSKEMFGRWEGYF